MRLNILIAAAGAACLAAFASPALSDEPAVRDITVVQQSFVNIAPPQQPFNVTAWVDREDNTYAPGDTLRIFARSNEDAYLTVINIGTSGRATILFPNQVQADSRVRAGQTVQIPGPNAGYSLQVSGPDGTDVIKVFATREPLSLEGALTLAQGGPFRSIQGDMQTAARDIEVVLNESHPVYASYHKVVRVRSAQPAPAPAPAPAPLEQFNLRLETDQSQYRTGQPVRVRVTSERACNLAIYNINASGRSTLLFPNFYQQTARIAANTPVIAPDARAPYIFQATAPGGVETLVAVCRVDAPHGFRAEFSDQAPFFRAEASDPVFRDIQVVPTANAAVGVATASVIVTE
jgi:hypothetical protein